MEYTTINPANAGHSSCPGWWAEHPTGGAQPVMRLTTQCTLAEDQSHASPVDDWPSNKFFSVPSIATVPSYQWTYIAQITLQSRPKGIICNPHFKWVPVIGLISQNIKGTPSSTEYMYGGCIVFSWPCAPHKRRFGPFDHAIQDPPSGVRWNPQ